MSRAWGVEVLRVEVLCDNQPVCRVSHRHAIERARRVDAESVKLFPRWSCRWPPSAGSAPQSWNRRANAKRRSTPRPVEGTPLFWRRRASAP